jgi:hypothetical protein
MPGPVTHDGVGLEHAEQRHLQPQAVGSDQIRVVGAQEGRQVPVDAKEGQDVLALAHLIPVPQQPLEGN